MMLDLEHQLSRSGFLQIKIKPSILGNCDRTVERDNGLCSSSSSSSIGMNSDDDDDDYDDDHDEVESKLKESNFDSAVDALEQALPIRRGISNFYNGKSKSFTSLADTASSSIKDITKPENAYSRKRKTQLAHSLLYEDRTSVLKSPRIAGGISKRSTGANRSTLALAVAMNNCEGRIDNKGSGGDVNMKNHSRLSSLSPPWRSFSLADLQQCGVSIGALNSNLCSPLMGKRTKRDEVS